MSVASVHAHVRGEADFNAFYAQDETLKNFSLELHFCSLADVEPKGPAQAVWALDSIRTRSCKSPKNRLKTCLFCWPTKQQRPKIYRYSCQALLVFVSERVLGYERVSTARQGASGLGLAAQRAAISAYALSRDAEVAETFTEVESGRKPDRPQLAKALHRAKVTGATVLIARLDRLSRNAAFLLALRDSGVHFIACNMPAANDLTVGIMALVAEAEREQVEKQH